MASALPLANPQLIPATTAIADYGLVGNGFSAALISIAGSVDWLCWPAFDSESVFGALLDVARGGRFALVPALPVQRSESGYLGSGFVMQTDIVLAGARLRRTEFLAGSALERQALLRRIEAVAGEAEIDVVLDVRPGYGARQAPPVCVNGALRCDDFWFRTSRPLSFRIVDGIAHARVRLCAGEALDFSFANNAHAWSFAEELRATRSWWESGPPIVGRDSAYGAVIERSVQLIHLMTYRPTGALVAAATTSLPEKIGGDRNYDYRYVWLRDVAFVIHSMLPRGQFQHATKRLIDWFVMSCIDPRAHVPIMFSIDARGEIEERVLSHLEGYAGSRPVRVGNAAVHQFQLDAYGELLLAVKLYAEHVGRLERGWWPLLSRLADDLARRWMQPDSGIWEERARPRQYLYSKVMTWAGLEAAVALALRFKLPGDTASWQENANNLRIYIDANYWNADIGAYVAVENGNAVDASSLLLGLYDYLPIHDARLTSTAEAVERDLCTGGLCYRHLEDESARANEGTFNLCTLWLVIYWARAGQKTRARRLFDAFLARANAFNLYSEEIDPDTGAFLGNYPQLFVHSALVVAADVLERDEVPLQTLAN